MAYVYLDCIIPLLGPRQVSDQIKANANREGSRSALCCRRAIAPQYMSSERKEGKFNRKANALISPGDKRILANQPRTMMEHSDLLEFVRMPLSPDVEVEVQASREDIIHEIATNQGISSDIRHGLTLSTESGNTRGRTTRGWDGVILYQGPNSSSLMIAVEVGVSQSYESLRAAIAWSVCALHCRLGIVMGIREQGRGQTPDPPQYSFIEVEMLLDRTDRGVTWFGRIKRVVLETYRIPDEDVLPETLLQRS
ncbi:hypothetical protein V1524DRAFT_473177 [Lipomyces starkeyi]